MTGQLDEEPHLQQLMSKGQNYYNPFKAAFFYSSEATSLQVSLNLLILAAKPREHKIMEEAGKTTKVGSYPGSMYPILHLPCFHRCPYPWSDRPDPVTHKEKKSCKIATTCVKHFIVKHPLYLFQIWWHIKNYRDLQDDAKETASHFCMDGFQFVAIYGFRHGALRGGAHHVFAPHLPSLSDNN